MAIHSSILVWKILCTEEPVGLDRAHGVAKSQTLLSTHIHTHRGTALREVVTFNFQCVALEMLEGHPCSDVIQEYVYTSLELKKCPGGTGGKAFLLMQET